MEVEEVEAQPRLQVTQTPDVGSVRVLRSVLVAVAVAVLLRSEAHILDQEVTDLDWTQLCLRESEVPVALA